VNSRLERFADGQVTFRYRDGRTGMPQRCTLDAVAFLGRFLQHVLPWGFSKVRHYGLFSPSRHDLLAQARAQLLAASDEPAPPRPGPDRSSARLRSGALSTTPARARWADQLDELGGVGAAMTGEDLVDEDGIGDRRRRRDARGADDECRKDKEHEAHACVTPPPR
jgi:hypothetical protein